MFHRGIFARPCYSCGFSVRSGFLCRTCRAQVLNLLSQPDNRCVICSADLHGGEHSVCPDCSVTKPVFQRNVSLAGYQDPLIREIFHSFKFRGDLRAGHEIALWVADRMVSLHSEHWKDFLVVPVPLSGRSLRTRGYNQVEMILRFAGISYRSVLERTSHKRSQSELSAQDRKTTIRGQFRVRKGCREAVRGRDILIVDDVFTTGSTASEISRILKAEGAQSVEILTIFRD